MSIIEFFLREINFKILEKFVILIWYYKRIFSVLQSINVKDA